MNTALKAILSSINETTLKDAKASVVEVVGMAEGDSDMGLEFAYDAVIKARTKAVFMDLMQNLINLTEVPEVEEGAVGEEMVTELERIKSEITVTIQSVGSGTFKLGTLLVQAQEEFDKAADFLLWVDENFGIKKAWCYRLMKVAKQFTAPVWSGVAIDVLYKLSQQAEPEQLEEAMKLAEAGKLDHSSIKSVLKEAAPVIREPVANKNAASAEVVTAGAAVVFDTGAGTTDVKLTNYLPVHSKDMPPAEPPADLVGVSDSQVFLNKISQLTDTLNDMQRRNDELQSQLMELSKPKLNQPATVAPMLRQFNSTSNAVKLGLSEEETKDKAAILDAFRCLCKAGYGRQHEAYAIIDAARHELCAALVGE